MSAIPYSPLNNPQRPVTAAQPEAAERRLNLFVPESESVPSAHGVVTDDTTEHAPVILPLPTRFQPPTVAPAPEIATAARQRIVLLGASNLELAFPMLASGLSRVFRKEMELLTVRGFGRSYGMSTRVVARQTPGIVESPIWETLQKLSQTDAEPIRPLAVVTDIGNDLLYNVSPQQTGDWVSACIDRLRNLDAEVVLTLLPVEKVRRLSPLRYHATRLVMFPWWGVSHQRMIAQMEMLNDRLRNVAESHGLPVVAPRSAWFRGDPIHIRLKQRAAAWTDIVSQWSQWPVGETLRDTDAADGAAFARIPPAKRTLGRWTWTTPQPAVTCVKRNLRLFAY